MTYNAQTIKAHFRSMSITPLILTLVACQTSSGHKNKKLDTNLPSIETRVFYGDCLRDSGIADKQSALLAIFGTALIKNTLSRVGKALRAAGEESAHIEAAHQNLEVSPPETTQCLQVVRARFKTNWGASDKTAALSHLQNSSDIDKIKNNLENSNSIIPFEDHTFFFEGQLRASSDDSALSLVPTFYDYKSPIKSGRSSSKPYGILLTMSIHNPGTPANDKSAAGASLALGAIKPGTSRVYFLPPVGETAPYGTPWFTNFAPRPAKTTPPKPKPDTQKVERTTITETVDENGVKNTVRTVTTTTEPVKPLTAAVATVGSGPTITAVLPTANTPKVNSKPKILSVSITETKKADEVILFFADVFDASKDELGTELGKTLIPSLRDAANQADYKVQQEAQVDYYSKVAAAETKLAEYCALVDGTSETRRRAVATETYSAQVSANISASSTDFGVPYPQPIEPGGNDESMCED